MRITQMKYVYRTISQLSFLLLALASSLSAQELQLTLIPGEEFSMARRDEWKLIVRNNTKTSVRAYLEGTVSEAKKGLIYHTRTSAREFAPGTETISTAYYPGLKPFTNLKDDGTLTEPAVRTNGFPAGDYEICISAYSEADAKEIGRICYSFSWDLYSSLILISPPDADSVRERFPFFSWFALSPKTAGSVSYKLSLYEMQNKQSPVAAVQANPPYYQSTVETRLIQYPMSAKNLNPGKRYAWKVSALVNKKSVAESEVWSFVYVPEVISDSTKKKDSTVVQRNPPIPGIAYSETLSDVEYRSRHVLASCRAGLLHVLYRHQSTTPSAAVRVLSVDGSVLFVKKLQVSYGSNYFSLPLQQWTKNLKPGVYELQCIDLNGSVQKLRFRFED